jgi:hypothetical protein
VGEALLQIGNHALLEKENMDSARIKLNWLAAILRNSGEIMELCNPPVDCSGNNTYSVFQHLFQHSGFEIISHCFCGIFYHQDYIIEVPDLDQLIILGTPQRINSAAMPKCLTCNNVRVLMDLNPLENNWLLVFNYNGTFARGNQSPNLIDIPTVVTIGTLTFKLEYLCYAQNTSVPNIGHEVSLHLIRRSWYLYDDAASPKLCKWYAPYYKLYKAQLRTIVYFRI